MSSAQCSAIANALKVKGTPRHISFPSRTYLELDLCSIGLSNAQLAAQVGTSVQRVDDSMWPLLCQRSSPDRFLRL